MSDDANDIFKSLLAKANRNLINECAELRAKLQAAEARVNELLEDNARGAAYIAHLKTRLRSVIEAGDAMAKLAGYVSPPLEWTAARQQGGAE